MHFAPYVSGLLKPRLEDILKTEDEDGDVLTMRRDSLGLGGACSSTNSLYNYCTVPSYYLVKYLYIKPVDQRAMSLVSAMLNMLLKGGVHSVCAPQT